MTAMKRRFVSAIQSKFLIAVVLVVGACGGATGAGTPHAQQSLPIVSDMSFRSDSEEYEYKASVLRSQELWTLIATRARGQLAGAQQFHLWKIDLQGRKVLDIDLTPAAAPERRQTGESRVYGLLSLKNGSLGLLVQSGGGLVLVSVNGDTGELVSSLPIKGPPSGAYIAKVFQDSDGRIFAVGRSDSRGLLVKLSGSGDFESNTFIEDAALTVLTDGVSLPDHSFMLLGEHLDDSGKTTTWLARVTQKGDVLSKTTFAGQGGAISCAGTNRCGMVYVLPGASGWRVLVRTFDGTLATSWETEAQPALRISLQWRLIARNDGTLLVAGGNAKQRLWLGSVSKDGVLITSTTFEETSAQWQRLWNFDLLSTSEEFVLPFTELVVGKELDQRQVFKVLRVQKP